MGLSLGNWGQGFSKCWESAFGGADRSLGHLVDQKEEKVEKTSESHLKEVIWGGAKNGFVWSAKSSDPVGETVEIQGIQPSEGFPSYLPLVGGIVFGLGAVPCGTGRL